MLEGKADWIKLQGGIDRWLGGVHLTGEQPKWRWDNEKKTLIWQLSDDEIECLILYISRLGSSKNWVIAKSTAKSQ